MRAEKATLTNLCMLTHQDKVLIEKRKNKNWSGVTFPGGHVEPKESFVDSVIREVYEETGLTIQDPILCGIKQFTTDEDGRYIVLLYKASKFTGQIKSSSEGEILWVNQKNLLSANLAARFEELYEVFTSQNSELYYFEDNGDWHTEIK
ncbi:8-oxo-dGTP diphosphatase [Liquorilactobacillus mali]|nr:NUDIX family hydrolase [Liquorilactobacillus mali KCTC 3596 = DSM 20444]QFQ74364.1 8-oxo-dGTP diphosphatase [Liquorilactobacillus mali]